jgi:pimeloyl-ACP methyl ester carboxylesterase
MNIHLFLIIVYCFLSTTACTQTPHRVSINTQPTSTNLRTGKQTFTLHNIPTDIIYPEDSTFIGTMLVLPGWNFPRHDWCEKSSLCTEALQRGYCLVMPEMGKSIYPTRYYPQSRKDWVKYPTLTWLTDTLIDTLQKRYKLFQPNQRNVVVGLSTGARGTLLVLMRKPNLWKAGGALSGDYIPEKIPTDNLLTGVYGSFQQNRNLWLNDEQPYPNVSRLKTPLYLGHGKKDAIVPFSQSDLFYQKLKKDLPDLKIIFHADAQAGHDYRYWNSEVLPMLRFFEEVK